MSSSAAGPNAIRLPVVVEIDQATNALKSLRRTADTETKGAATSMQANLAAAEKNVTASFASATRSATTFKEAVRGAGPAITGLSAALGQSAGPLGAFSRSILSIVSNGFNPLGVAIGVVTAATAAWIGKSREAADAAAEEKRRISELAVEYVRLADAVTFDARLGAAQFGARYGGAPKSLQEAEANARRAEMALESATASNLATGSYGPGGPAGYASLVRNVELTREKLEMEREIARAAGYVTDEEKKQNDLIEARAQRRQANALATEENNFMMRRFSAGEQALDSLSFYEPGMGATLAPSAAARARGMAGENSTLLGGWSDDMLARQTGGMLDGQTGRFPGEKPFSIGFTASVLPPTAAEKYAKGFGDAFTSGVTDAAVDLANSGDIGGFFRSIADQAQQAIYNGIISGFIEGTGLRSAAASVGQQLFGAGASALTAGAGGGDTTANGPMVSDAFFAPKSAKAGGGDTIVIALVPDEAAADTMLSKASHRGAKALAVRMDGRGVAAGSIPTRRRG